MAETEVHPIDVEGLQKGEVIPAERIAMITGKRRGTQQYQFALLNLREWIHKTSEELGCSLLLRLDGENLRVMTDAEAVHRVDAHGRAGLRMLGRAVHRFSLVDVRNLKANEQALLDRHRSVHGTAFAAACQARQRALSALPHQRSIPGALPCLCEDAIEDEDVLAEIQIQQNFIPHD